MKKIIPFLLILSGCVAVQNNIKINLPVDVDVNKDGKMSKMELMSAIELLYEENQDLKEVNAELSGAIEECLILEVKTNKHLR